MFGNLKLEIILVWLAVISVVGVVVILILKELDVISGDVLTPLYGIINKILSAFGAVWQGVLNIFSWFGQPHQGY